MDSATRRTLPSLRGQFHLSDGDGNQSTWGSGVSGSRGRGDNWCRNPVQEVRLSKGMEGWNVSGGKEGSRRDRSVFMCRQGRARTGEPERGAGACGPVRGGGALWASRAEGAAMVPVAAGWVTEGRQRG